MVRSRASDKNAPYERMDICNGRAVGQATCTVVAMLKLRLDQHRGSDGKREREQEAQREGEGFGETLPLVLRVSDV